MTSFSLEFVLPIFEFPYVALSLLCQFRHAACNSPPLFLCISHKSEAQNIVSISCGSTVRKFGLCDEIVKSLKFSNMKVELKIGVVSQRAHVNRLTSNKPLVTTDVVS